MGIKRTAIALAAVTILSLVVGACSGADDESAGDAASVPGIGEAPAADGEGFARGLGSAGGAAVETGSLGAPNAGVPLPRIGPSVIKTADVSLEVAKDGFKDSVRDAVAVAERYGGYVVTTSVEDQRLGLGSLTLRVPADDFEAALSDLHELGKLKGESIEGRDVGQEFIDLEARLRNFRSQETVLLRLMRRSQSVQDTLRVQSHLQQTQLEIERLQGRLNFLRDQTDMSTIRVSLAEAGAKPVRTGIIGRAWQRAIDMTFSVIAAVIVGAGFVLPVALLAGIAVFLFARVRPRLNP